MGYLNKRPTFKNFFISGNYFQQYGFEYGNLSELYHDETYEQIKTRRQSNWNILKTLCNDHKITGEIINPAGGIVEIYRPSNDYVELLDTHNLKIYGSSTEFVFYPFTYRSEANYYPFKFQYGSSCDFRNLTSKCAQKQGKFETYDVILKKGGNLRLIEITESVRAGFWTDLQVGNTIYYTDQPSDLAESRVVQSFDSTAKTITVTVDIGVGIANNATGIACRNFNEDISEEDYNTYGDFWVAASGFVGQNGIFHIPVSSTGNATNFNFKDVIFENWWVGISISSGNFHVTYDNILFDNCGVGFSAFARSQINGQSVIGVTKDLSIDNLKIKECGYYCVGQITADNSRIYGAGVYWHPTVIATLPGTTRCLNNTANGLRQYSASLDTQTPYATYIENFVASGGIEYDLYTSCSMPVTIDNFEGDELRIGGTITVNRTRSGRNEIRRDVSSSTLLEPPHGTPVRWEFNDTDIYCQSQSAFNVLTEDVHTSYFNDCKFFVNEYGVIPQMLTIPGELYLNNPQMLKNPTANIPTYVPGSAVPSGNDCSYLFIVGSKKVVIDNLITDSLKGGLILQSPSFNFPAPLKTIEINDSDINLSKLINTNPTITDTYRTNGILGQRTKVEAFNYGYMGYSLPLAFTAKEASSSNVSIATTPQTLYIITAIPFAPYVSFVVSGVLYTDLDYDEYFVNAGTINHICLRTWQGVNPVTSASIFTGSITIHAVGGDVVINGWDATTNQYGNVESSVTITSGTSITLTCNNKRVFAKDANTAVSNELLFTGNGSVKVYQGLLVNMLAANTTFTITVGAVTATAGADGLFTGTGVVAGSYIDYWTGAYYLSLVSNVGNGVQGLANYERYTNWRILGVYELP